MLNSTDARGNELDQLFNSSESGQYKVIGSCAQTPSTIVFIDSGVDDYQTLVNGVVPEAEVIVLDSTQDGVEQITKVLKEQAGIAAIHLVSHGSPGCLYLGNSQLSLDTLSHYATQLKTWIPSTSVTQGGKSAAILLYGCNVAAGDAGEEFVTRLGQLTGGNIAASAKRTGSVALGGDWKLEVTTNQIQVSLAFEAMVQEAYTGVLATFLVNNTGDFDDGDIGNGVTTLREAINAANATSTDDIIEFASGLSGQTITLTNGQLEITDDLFIDGLGADQLTISGNNASRIFNIDDGDAFNSFDVKISGLSIADGNADFGGGIFNEEQLLISSSTIRDNTAQFSGGGIFSDGRLNIENSTISGNTAEIGPGGAISGSDFLAMTNVTISGNQAGNNGGGISFGAGSGGNTLMVDSSTITQNTTNGNGGGIFSNLGNPNDDLIAINNSIIAQNFDNDSSDGNSPDVWGQFSSNNRFNLIGDLGDNTSNGDFLTAEGNQVGTSANPIDPMLGPLQNNGGPTFTHALLPGSPAIDTANPFGDVAVDQRGVSRSLSNPDIGAFEALLPPNKRGVSWGDPHIETFDGKNYEFQTLGEFVLVESNSGDLQIQVRQERFNNTSNRVSVNTAVATLVDGTNVGFYLGQNQSLEIDGIDTSLSNGSFLTVGNSHITRVGNTFTIIYAGDDGIVTNEDDRLEVTLYNNHITTEVFLSREREGSVQGILGNGDMDPTNDFALRNGTVLSDQLSLDEIYGEYADSWRISQQESLFNYDPGEDTSTFTELDFPNQTIPLPITVNNLDNLGFTEDQLMNAENVARDAGIPEGPMFDAAVLDFLITNDDSFIDAGADVIDQTPAPLISLTVDTLVDENDGVLIPGDVSLREAILFALPGATINFDPSLAGGTIDLTLGELIIDKDLTINGLGADKLTISGNNTSRVFKVDDGNPNNLINLEISGLTIAEGSTDEGGGIFSTETLSITNSTIRNNQAGDTGGGLYNDGGILNIYNSIIRDNIGHTDTGGIENRGTMMIDNSTISNNQGGSFAGGIRNLSGTATITNSTISGNKANSGGGISNGGYGALLIANSTISGNSALDSGGGIYASSGSLRVFNSTITLNTADSDGDNLDNDDGGGINALSSSTVEVKNTIIAGNFDKSNSGNINPDVAGDFINSSFNFIGDATGSNSFTNNVDGNQVGTSAHPIDPMLGDLQDNGGPTFTHAPLPGSPVLDAANPLAGVTVDQRGISRPQGEGFDIGAVEGSLNPSSVGTRDSDRIVGDSGNNGLNGGRGADVIFGGAGNDTLRGAGGDDILKGEDGNDRLMGHGGNNFLFGGNDNDTLWGGQRNDLLDGGAGSDRLFGQNGNDTLLGGHDLDLLEGGRGNDLMTGGEGNDIFQLRQSDFMGGTFVDQILDFNAAEDDRLRLVDISMDEVMFNKIGTSDLELTFTFGGKVTFVGVTDAIFVASNVDFDATRLGNNSPLPVS